MASTQQIRCIACGAALGNIDTISGKVRVIKVKQTTEGEIPSIEKEASLVIDNNNSITCTCGQVNKI